jgi:small nuclear ribonucleoprotein (snRNP)-like protein
VIVALSALALATVAAVAYILVSRRRSLRRLLGERVVLQTRDDRSLRGVLTGVYVDCVAVSHFEYLDEAQAAGLPGEATVRFDNLSWIHRLGPGD